MFYRINPTLKLWRCITQEIEGRPLYNAKLVDKFITKSQADRGMNGIKKAVYCFVNILNCKNVTAVENTHKKKLSHKKGKTKPEFFTYKTLALKPTGKKQENQASKGLWDNRIHLCRGHFKTYTKDNPLFGRIVGTYWWQPSIRGNKKKGVVMKDYVMEGKFIYA